MHTLPPAGNEKRDAAASRPPLTIVKERPSIFAHWGRMNAAIGSLLLLLNVLALCLYGAAAAADAVGGMGGEGGDLRRERAGDGPARDRGEPRRRPARVPQVGVVAEL